MNKQKRKNYVLNGSYHTLEIKSPKPTKKENVSKCINTNVNKDGTQATSIINPNKDENGDIFTFNEFRNTFNKILADSGIYEYRITRADMRFDNYDNSHYLAFAKLNKYIISTLMVTYKVRNKYIALDLVSETQLSIAIKNDYFECENYDREYKNEVTNNQDEPAKARLEERTKGRQWRKLTNKELFYSESDYNMELLKKEFTDEWGNRWNKAKDNLKAVQDIYNDALVKEYQNGINIRPVQFRTLTDFIIKNQNRIFTSMQLVDLLKRLGVENPENRAKYHKKKYGIEYFSKQDVEYAINELARATKEYFKE